MADRRTLSRRIKAKLDELQDDLAERRQAQRAIARADATIGELDDELRLARRRVQRRRAAVAEVREDLRELEAETPDEDTPEEAELRARRDQLAGELEEAVATRDLILAKIDRAAENRADARAALEAAIAESADDREALARMRRRRARMREAADRPSPNFTWAEFDCNDGTPAPEASRPAIRHWCETVGEPLRAKYGPVYITSPYRHRAYNASIGGEPNSVHIYDYPGRACKAAAVDFKCARGTPAEWYEFTAGKADGRGLYSTFHHADNRNRIGWADATWRG